MSDDVRDDTLSSQGRLRRDAMRQELCHKAIRHHRRRRTQRRMAWSMAGVFLVAISVWGAMRTGSTLRSSSSKQPIAQAPPTLEILPSKQHGGEKENDAPPLIRIMRVNTRVDVASVSISDEELLETLAKMGRRTGLARIGDRVILTQPVTDEEIARAKKKRAPANPS